MGAPGPGLAREDDEMSCLPLKRIRTKEWLMLAVLLGSFPSLGCGNPGVGTIQIPPGARRFGTDPVIKQRPDAGKYKKAAPAPVEPGKFPPGRGRMVE
jgi:hypothetical protein